MIFERNSNLRARVWVCVCVRRNDNINKICVLEGVGEGENLRKIVPNAVFPGKFHDNKIRNFASFIVKHFVVIWEAAIIGKR